jgi:NAD(P)-dependent dehydrogenase (short-subunit alcohol dehydrogenase family)
MKKGSRIFITGSVDGLGLMAAQWLIGEGHSVVLHARNKKRAEEAMNRAPGAQACVIGDVASIREMKSVADQVNNLGAFDAVIHNAAVGYREAKRVLTEDGLPQLFAINTLAPNVLTALIQKPKRLVYLSSGLHQGANPDLDNLLWEKRAWDGMAAYSESKFHDVLIAFGVARRWPAVFSNALEPGWVATKMGGPGATGDLSKGHLTQAWLAVSDDPLAKSTGEYFYHQALRAPNRATRDVAKQEVLFAQCEKLSAVAMPR